MIIVNNGETGIYPKVTSSYVYSIKEEEKFERAVVKMLKRKRLPKSLEISWVEKLLKNLKDMPEHEYSRKYDTGEVEHPIFY